MVSVLSRACRFAGDDKRVGVATSRLAQILTTAIQRLETTGIKSFIDANKLAEVAKEAAPLVPHLQAVACMFYILACSR